MITAARSARAARGVTVLAALAMALVGGAPRVPGVPALLGLPGGARVAEAAQYEEIGAPGAPVAPFTPLSSQLTEERLGALMAGRAAPARGGWTEAHFSSQAIHGEGTYMAWLPPGYYASTRSYPTLYLLHGVGGATSGFGAGEWLGYGITEDLERLLALGVIEPMIVVIPEGGMSYWVNHADDGPRWADFVARDLVKDVDTRFRTVASRDKRAIGGLSMGGHGALQIALNYPDVFAVAGAHSPALRERAELPSFFGDEDWYKASDPEALLATDRGDAAARRVATWIDIAAHDPWLSGAQLLRDRYSAQQAPLDFRVLEGDHEGWYWMEYLPEYLRWYSGALYATRTTATGAPIVAVRPVPELRDVAAPPFPLAPAV